MSEYQKKTSDIPLLLGEIMKKNLYLTFVITLSSCLLCYGCGKAEQTPEKVTFIEAQDTPITGTVTDDIISFPEHYEKTVDQVIFDMNVTVDTDLNQNQLVTAKAQMQKANEQKAFELFFSTINTYDTYDYEGENEYGNTINTGTLVSPEETTLSYGPLSSQIEYMERDLLPYVHSAFILDMDDERYNADLYSKTSELTFLSRENAFNTISDTLAKLDFQAKYIYTAYTLNYPLMQSHEYHVDMDGNIDSSRYKNQWSSSDEGYYFCINQTHRELPIFYIQNSFFSEATDINAPIQVFITESGMEYFDVEKIFHIFEENENVQLTTLDAITDTVANKYNQILGTSTYELTKARLYYFVDLSSGTGTYEIKPVWIIQGTESNSEGQHFIQTIIDAQTAKEIIP